MEKEQPEECSSCGYPTTKLKKYSDDNWFCDLCANTQSANAYLYPSNDRTSADTMLLIAHVGNIIIDEIRKVGTTEKPLPSHEAEAVALERAKIYKDLMAVADAQENEGLRVEVERYFTS